MPQLYFSLTFYKLQYRTLIEMQNKTEESEIPTPKSDDYKLGFNILSILLQRNASTTGIQNPHLDDNFILQILKIANKKKNEEGERLFGEDKQLSNEKCEQIHEKAIFHAQANTFNQYSALSLEEIPKSNQCSCGCLRGKGQPLPFSTNEDKQFFFGPGILLFFFYLKKVLLLVSLISLLYGIFALATNIMERPSQFPECSVNPGIAFLCQFKLMSTTRNKSGKERLVITQLWLGFLFCLIWMVGIKLIQSFGRILNEKIDLYLDSSSDYCIQVDNLPFGQYTQGQLMKHLLKLWKKQKKDQLLKIKSVQIIYKMNEARTLIEQIFAYSKDFSLLVEKIGEKYKVKDSYKESAENLKENISNSIEKLEELRRKFIQDSSFRAKFATDMALIEFDSSDQQTQFVEKVGQRRTTIFDQIKEKIFEQIFPSEEQSNLFKGQSLRIIRAPEPSDIHWSNCEKPFSYKKVMFIWLMTFGVIGLSFGMLMLIAFLRDEFQVLKSLSILISISLQFFNRFIWILLVEMIGFEENNTKTDSIISIMSKSSFAQSINVILLPIIVNLIVKDNLEGPQGLIGLSLDFQFTVFFMMLNLNLINFPYQIKRLALTIPPIRNKLIIFLNKQVGFLDPESEIKDVLNFYEPPQFPIASSYVYITTIIYHAIFFCYAQPTLLFYLIFNIICFFLVQKYILLRRCKIPQLVDFLIFQTCISMMKNVPFFYGAGSLMFITLLQKEPHLTHYIPSCLCLLVWILYVFNPKKIFSMTNSCLLRCCEDHSNKVGDEACSPDNEDINLTRNVLRFSIFQSNFSKRRQCYYKSCNFRVLLNYEQVLTQTKSEQVFDRNKEFCERFHVNTSKQRKQSFIENLLGKKDQQTMLQGKKRLIPIQAIKNKTKVSSRWKQMKTQT